MLDSCSQWMTSTNLTPIKGSCFFSIRFPCRKSNLNILPLNLGSDNTSSSWALTDRLSCDRHKTLKSWHNASASNLTMKLKHKRTICIYCSLWLLSPATCCLGLNNIQLLQIIKFLHQFFGRRARPWFTGFDKTIKLHISLNQKMSNINVIQCKMIARASSRVTWS